MKSQIILFFALPGHASSVLLINMKHPNMTKTLKNKK